MVEALFITGTALVVLGVACVIGIVVYVFVQLRDAKPEDFVQKYYDEEDFY